MKRIVLTGFLVTAALGMAACEGTKEQFDISKKAPDEFAITKRAPLEMPPDYTLRPPRPGAPRPQEPSADAQAKAALLGDAAAGAPVEGLTAGESILLKKSGASQARSNIRDQIDKETAEQGEEAMPGIDKLKKMIGKDVEAPAVVVDPKAETERIKQNKSQGKPVTAGKTPSIEE
jgi:hypothetical protein